MDAGAIILTIMFSAIAGFGFVGSLMAVMRRTTGHKGPAFEWSSYWVGCAERGVTTALTIWQPDNLKWFIGAWVTAKLAANWKRMTNSEQTRLGHVLALVGNLLSFAFAIVVGLIAPLIL